MSKFINELIALCEANTGSPDAKGIIKDLRPIVARYTRDNHAANNLRMTEAERMAVASDAPTIESNRPAMKPMTFTSADFEAPNQPPQVAPPADSEVKAQEASKGVSTDEKEIMELYDLGAEKAEEKFKDVESFVARAKELGATFKNTPKDFGSAWLIFEKHTRKKLDF